MNRGVCDLPKGQKIGNFAMIRPMGVAVLAAFTLSACAPVETFIERWFPPETAARTAVGSAVSSAEAPPLPRRKPEAPMAGALAIGSPMAAPMAVEPVAESPEAVTLAGADPQRLVGLDFDGTKALLGDPAAQMEQPPAKVWAYAGGGCMFSVFFFPSIDDKIFRVLAVEVTDEPTAQSTAQSTAESTAEPPAAGPTAHKVMDQDDPAVRRCFANLLQTHQSPNAG
jgi:hypothetical protein